MRGGFARWCCAAWLAAGALLVSLAGCDNSPWESGVEATNTLFSAMRESSPRHLDPTASYWQNDTPFTYQIYEPLYGYHYLKRPYALMGKTAQDIARPAYYDKGGKRLPDGAPGDQIAESVYDIHLKHGILYQPHPCFAKDDQGHYLYHSMRPGELGKRWSPLQFARMGTRELVADDYVYALKRHATTRITAPIFGVFSKYVIGLADYGKRIKREDAALRQGLDPSNPDLPFLDFRKYPLEGVSAPDKYTLRIRLHGKYPQWNYWMATTFMAPVPWEADAFYAQPGMVAANLTLDTWPVGTGPFMETEYFKDRRQVMERNPNYRGEPYPCEGGPGDKAAGRLDDCGKRTPFIDRIVMTVEREKVPERYKFRQGFYDLEVFERTDTGNFYLVGKQDSDAVRDEYDRKGFRLDRFDDIWKYNVGFNMLDPVVGKGATPAQDARNRALRQALSIAIDWEEYSRVFPQKAGLTAQGELPNGIFGSRQSQPGWFNPITHRLVDGKVVRRPIEDARKLMVAAGYPDGRDARTGQPLTIHYDFYAPPTPEWRPEIAWMVRQFAKLGVQLEVRATDNNQFQDKVRKGKHQFFWYGWNADYPDAENFLVLQYGPNGKSLSDGENQTNYSNPAYDRLFEQLKTLDDGPAKQAVIDQMTAILQVDAPESFGFFPYSSAAVQHWVYNSKPSIMILDGGRYLRLDVAERTRALAQWNRPLWWPLVACLVAACGLVLVALRAYRRRQRTNARGEVLLPVRSVARKST